MRRVTAWHESWGGMGLGVVLILAAAALAEALALLAGPEHGLRRVPILLPLAAVAFVASVWGLRAGLAGAALGAAYSLHFFAAFGSGATLGESVAIGAVLGAFMIAMAALLGHLRSRGDRATARALAAERERAEAERDRARATHEVNETLRRTNETLEAFTYVVSHDLKEPVRALRVLNEALVADHADAMPPDARDVVRLQGEAAVRLSALLSGLLEMGRAVRADPAERHPVWLAEALGSPECRARYQDLLAERDVRLEVTCLHGTPPVLATTAAVCQVLGNLVVNAVKHNPNTSPLVRLRIHPLDAERTEVEAVVEDDGPGFPDAMLARFHDSTPGTLRDGGFGLLIVRRGVEHLGGRVRLDRSRDLGGAAVHVVFPAATGEAMREDRPRGSAPGRGRREAPAGHREV